MVIKVSDPTGEAWLSVFNEQAEKIIGCTADELDRIKTEVVYHMLGTGIIRVINSMDFDTQNIESS